MKTITDDIRYIGVDDHEIDLFEGQYSVPHGMCYNSYVIYDERIAVMDSVDRRFTGAWLENLRGALAGKKPDYLVISHMEPDHSASIAAFAGEYPEAAAVGNARTFAMMDNFYGPGLFPNRVTVSDGERLSLGTHALTFLFAPMVHWPEVMVSYEEKDGALFSADAFGRFGASDAPEGWAGEARRYYIGIVGKYGVQVQGLLKKAAALDIRRICPLHGPVLIEGIDRCVDLYDKWSSYTPEEEGLVIAYTSVYGHTKQAAELLARCVEERSGMPVTVHDLARTDMSLAVADAFRYSKLVLATTTYNGDVFPFMKEFIDHLTERNFQKRTVGFIENGSWAPQAFRIMSGMMDKCKDVLCLDQVVTIKSAMTEANRAAVAALAAALLGD